MDLLQAMRISSTGLTAQRTKMNVIAENLANAETTRTAAGGPYRRKMVVFEANPLDDFPTTLQNQQKKIESGASIGVDVSEIVQSQEDFRLVHNPAHPDADPETGYVAMPNVDPLTEMADMLVARRAYDAGAAVLANTRGMIMKALEIGK